MALMEYSQDTMQASILERDRESQNSSLKSLQEAEETRLLAPSPEGSATEIHGASENRLPPCFIRASDGGLVTGSIIPPHTVFGPYKGTIKMKVSTEDEEIKESYDLKTLRSTRQHRASIIEVDQTESKPPWWMCIKQTTAHRNVNIALISYGGAVYLKTLRQIPKSTELQMVIAAPSDGAEDNGDPENSRSSSSNEATPDASPSPSQSKANTSTEGPPFKCSFCCIEFRNPSNLEAHRVYYCPGTATEPLPSSRRRSTTTISSRSATTHSQVTAAKISPPRLAQCRDTPMEVDDVPEVTARTFVCQLCQSSFECRNNCESHMLLLHCDETANLCKFCNFISRNRQGLCQHVFSHVRELSQEKSTVEVEKVAEVDWKSTGGKGEDEGDEKENRYETVIMCRKTGNRIQIDRANSAPSPRHKRLTSSPSNPRSRSVSNLSSPYASPRSNPSSVIKVERCGSATPVREHGQNGADSVVTTLKQEPQEDNILSCPKCDFVTSRQSSLQKHLFHHNDLIEKTQDIYVSVKSQMSTDSQVNESIDTDAPALLSDTKCHECNIVFISKKNYSAHKQYYCASRHANSDSPPASLDSDVTNIANGKESSSKAGKSYAGMDRQRMQAMLKDVESNEPCTSKSAAVSRSPPFDTDERDNCSPRNGSLHRTSHLNLSSPSSLTHTPVSSTSKSSCDDRVSFEHPLRMIPMEGSGRPQFLPPGAMLHGPQLVLVTPVVFPQNGSEQGDKKLRIPVIRTAGRGEQPLDLSTKPKTPPLGNVAESTSHKIVISREMLQSPPAQQTFPEQQSGNRCEECEITFSKKESLLVHKEYYCAGRHVFTPRTVVRTKQHSMHKFSNQSSLVKSPSPNTHAHGSPMETSFLNINPKGSYVRAFDNPGCDSTPSPQSSTHSASYTPLAQQTANTTARIPASQISPVEKQDWEDFRRHKSWSPKLKRAALDGSDVSDNEWSLPPIKRKRNLMHIDTEISPSSSSGSLLSNGVVVKQEPKDFDSVMNPHECMDSQRNQNKESLSTTSSPVPPHRSSVEIQTDVKIKHEPGESIAETNGRSPKSSIPHHATPTSSSKLHHRESRMDSANRPRHQSRPPVMIHSVTPLTIPVYKHPSIRQPQSSTARITVNSYLTGTSRPLLRGLKPTVKHCRNCNISFSSLSTFIAHKKYYCASHHQAKDTAT
ncbi:uncharacterized protein [Asterias amurensis]|uniref:uncharacterized protein n=1 Tax=Asterias amurensis TaxID=7602 RepID=UPI003AB632A3